MLLETQPGFNPDNVMRETDAAHSKYKERHNLCFLSGTVRRVKPCWCESAAAVNYLPPDVAIRGDLLLGLPEPRPVRSSSRVIGMHPRLFPHNGPPVLKGREFTDHTSPARLL